MLSKIVLVTLAALALAGCEPPTNSDQKQRVAQEQLAAEAHQQVGMPAIRNFQEKRFAKMILELRDTSIRTQTYTIAMDGRLMKICDSIGYGLPYTTQYTNPQRMTSLNSNPITLPQADPNGLFSPAQADGTWVLCLSPEDQKTVPIFVEPRVIVSPFPLKLTEVK